MKKLIAARTTVAFIVGLSLAQHAFSQSGNDVSPTDVARPVAESSLPAVEIHPQSDSPGATDSQIERLLAIQLSPARNLAGARSSESVNTCVVTLMGALVTVGAVASVVGRYLPHEPVPAPPSEARA